MDSGITNQPGIITPKLGSWTENLPEDITPESSVLDTTDWFSTFKTAARAIGTANATLGTVDEYGRQTSAPESDVDAKTLQEKYPQLPGQPAFDKPMPDSVASSIYEHQQDENRIADAKARRPAGFWNGAATLGTQFAADLLDPLNIAAMFVPVVGEGSFVAEGAGLAARIGAKAATGAVNASVGQIPLIAMKYGQSKLENDDYGAWKAMSDLATGAAMGVVGHLVGSAIGYGAKAAYRAITGTGDTLAERMASSPIQSALEADPALRSSALNTAISQAASDNPVEVRPVFDAAGLHAATEARNSLLEEASNIPDIAPDSPAFNRIQAIDEELGGSQRLAAIDAELGGVIPAARREALEAERGMIAEGASPEHTQALKDERQQIIDLETARAEAARSGLTEAAGRSEAEIASHLRVKRTEAYSKLEDMVKAEGGTTWQAYLATTKIGDVPIGDLEREFQQARAAHAASQSAGGGERPAVPGSDTGAGAGGAQQVVGTPQPEPAGGGTPGEVAGPAGGAGAAAGPGAGATVSSRFVRLRNAVGGAGAEDSTGLIGAFQGAGKAMGDNLRNVLWDSFQKGHATEGGMRSPVLEAAQLASATIKSRADFDQFLHDYYTRRSAASDAALALKQKTSADTAQRAADGLPDTAAQAVTKEAEAATKVPESDLVKKATQDIADHQEFFKGAAAAGVLTDEDRAALQGLSAVDENAKSLTGAAMQAAACIARGLI